jgi:hypothetical protein
LNLAVEAAGWLGAILILVAYALVSTGRLDPRGGLFQWMNLVGAAGFVVNSGWHGAWPSTILNIIWIGIALLSLARLARPRPR